MTGLRKPDASDDLVSREARAKPASEITEGAPSTEAIRHAVFELETPLVEAATCETTLGKLIGLIEGNETLRQTMFAVWEDLGSAVINMQKIFEAVLEQVDEAERLADG